MTNEKALAVDWSSANYRTLPTPSDMEAVRKFLQSRNEYGGDCESCGYPIVKGRRRCTVCYGDF